MRSKIKACIIVSITFAMNYIPCCIAYYVCIISALNFTVLNYFNSILNVRKVINTSFPFRQKQASIPGAF